MRFERFWGLVFEFKIDFCEKIDKSDFSAGKLNLT